MKFKVGDKVKVAPDIDMGDWGEQNILEPHKIYIISKINSSSNTEYPYALKEIDGFSYADKELILAKLNWKEMFERRRNTKKEIK